MDQQPTDPLRDDRSTSGTSPATMIGVAVILFGLYLLIKSFGVFIPGFAIVMDLWDRAGWPLAVMATGVVILLASRRSGFAMPQPGTRLVRSREDRMLAGVLGGVARYFGTDPTLVRLAYVGLALLTDAGMAIVAYVVLAIVVPKAAPGQEPGRPAD